MVVRVRRLNVIIRVSLRPSWYKFEPHGLHDREVTDRMESLAESALNQFSHEDYVTVSATYDDDSDERRVIVRSRGDFTAAIRALPEANDIMAENRELRARVRVLELLLEEHGLVAHVGHTIAPHSPHP